MGRSVVKILFLGAALWAGWWAISTTGLQRGLTAWMEAPRSSGVQITTQQITRAGFPLRIETALQSIAIISADGQSSLNIPEAIVSAPVYWPGHAQVAVPAGKVGIASQPSAITLSHEGGEAAVRLRPNTDLTLQSARIIIASPRLDLVEGRIAGSRAVQAFVVQRDTAAQYHFDFNAIDLTAGSVLRQAMRLPNAWPVMFEHFDAAGYMMLDRPLDRGARAGNRPQPIALKIDSARAVWGEIGLEFAADVTVAAGGILTGTATLRADNWRKMLDLAQNAGTLTEQTRAQIESALTLLSGMSDGGNSLDAQITITDGQMRLGFFPLGPAPRLVIP
jgi:hypothetical protein